MNKELSWEVIVDRSRRIDKPSSWESVDSIINMGDHKALQLKVYIL